MGDEQIPAELIGYVPVMMIVLSQLKETPIWIYLSRWIGLISLAVGVGIAFMAMPDTTPIVNIILGGLLLGAGPIVTYKTTKSKPTSQVNNSG